MAIVYKISCAGLAAMVLMTTSVVAKECRDEAISATSREYLSRSLGAFPGSWAAWRKEVKEQLGNGWQAWRRAEQRNITCDQNRESRRWTCTRTAKPCRPGSARDTASNSSSYSGSNQSSTNNDDRYDTSGDYPPISKVLRRGMKDDQVKTLQYLLREAGYDVEIDGSFGRGTETKIRDFQRKSGLTVDGRAGPKTVEALTS